MSREEILERGQGHATELRREAGKRGAMTWSSRFGWRRGRERVPNGAGGFELRSQVLPGRERQRGLKNPGTQRRQSARRALLSLDDEWDPRRTTSAGCDERHFVFDCGGSG